MKIELDQSFPVDYELPTKRRVRIDYQSFPKIEAKVQEFFGVQQHPLIGGEPVSIDLLSPAMRPIQRTNDLISFFKGSYADVKKEMKSKYPRHNWPDEPLLEKPSFRSIKSKPKT